MGVAGGATGASCLPDLNDSSYFGGGRIAVFGLGILPVPDTPPPPIRTLPFPLSILWAWSLPEVT